MSKAPNGTGSLELPDPDKCDGTGTVTISDLAYVAMRASHAITNHYLQYVTQKLLGKTEDWTEDELKARIEALLAVEAAGSR